MGNVRGGKSYSSISLAFIHQALKGKLFNSDYICSNSQVFLQKIQRMPREKLIGSIFIIDEDKGAMYGFGSMAKKQKMLDVQNIIAINNISTISICPTAFSNDKSAQYGLRVFGRHFGRDGSMPVTRLMLYNLQESQAGGSVPMGNIYIPLFTSLIPKKFSEPFEEEYLTEKHRWVDKEMRGQGDVLASLRKKKAFEIFNDPVFKELKKKGERLEYISMQLGSEWTKSECDSVLNLTKFIEKGIIKPEIEE
jgi:hypothetical protein